MNTLAKISVHLAAGRAADEPIPLVADRTPSNPYPVDDLGPILAPMARYVMEATQCADVTAAQSVLAVASLAAQAHAEILTPAGGAARPLSLFFVTVAFSGERKSAADHYALSPVREVEDAARDDYARDYAGHCNALEAWETARGRAKKTKGGSADIRDALEAVGPEPLPPLAPMRTVTDTTAEGLLREWRHRHGSLGLFSAEGAAVIGGHSMSDDARLRTAAMYSTLWDGGTVDRTRAGDGYTVLRGRRLACHLMAQPGVASKLLASPELVDQGLTARFLVAEAPTLAGTRIFRAPPPQNEPRRLQYGHVIRSLLTRTPDTGDGRNELTPRILTLSSEAETLWIEAYNVIEGHLDKGGRLENVRSLGSKLAEQAARIGGVVALMADPNVSEIDEETMRQAITLAGYYGAEAARLDVEARIDAALALAERLRAWLVTDWPHPVVSAPDIMRLGPNVTRPKAVAERCIGTLIEHGWLVPGGPGDVAGVQRREVYTIRRQRDGPS